VRAGTRSFRALTIAAFCALALTGLVAVAAPPDEKKATPCSADNSEPATVAQIAAHPDVYEGRCVAVDATMQGRSLFESVDGVYLEPPDSLNPSSSGLRIGLDNISDHYSERYRGVSILGRVQDCETVRNCAYSSAGDNEFVMVTGYCHSFNGAYLWIHELRFRRGPPFLRRMGSSARSDYGNLVPAPDEWAHRAKVEALASEFLRALQRNDRHQLAAIHFRNVGLEWEDDEAALLRFLLKDQRSPFDRIRTARSPPQQIILVDRSMVDEPDEDYLSTVCFCREKDCTGRWPIATFDADNVPSRPYACTEIGPYLLDHGVVVPYFTTIIGKGGLLEPDRRR
jgi:hypothetical protein